MAIRWTAPDHPDGSPSGKGTVPPAASTTATRSRSAIKYASTSSSIWRMRARLLSAPRMSNGSRDCSLRNVSRIGLIQLNTPLPTWRIRQKSLRPSAAEILARAAYPQRRSSNANSLWGQALAGPTRVVMLFQIHGARTDSGVRVLPPQPRSRLFPGPIRYA
jgi:hypothetical protein